MVQSNFRKRSLRVSQNERLGHIENWETIVYLAALAPSAVVGIGLLVLKTAIKTSAEEGARTAIKNINWPEELRQELEKSRGVERQELRFKSYGRLWNCLRPLAVYAKDPLGRDQVAELSDRLSEWYFSECGGMLMTSHVREFYFAMQDLARSIGDASEDWQCHRHSGDYKDEFEKILKRMNLGNAVTIMDKLSEADLTKWPPYSLDECKRWRTDVAGLGRRWGDLSEDERFVVLQQVGSVLRTNLANDVESRMR